MFKNVLVGVDDGQGGRDAIALARVLRAPDGELTLAHILAHDGHGYRGPSAAYEASGWARAAELLEKVPFAVALFFRGAVRDVKIQALQTQNRLEPPSLSR